MRRGYKEPRVLLVCAAALCMLAGCEVNPKRRGEFQAISMWNQSRLKPLEESPMLPGRSSAEPLVPGTVARGAPPADATLVTGLSGGKLATRFPFPVTEAVVKRGQDRFNVYCAPCHGRLGDGQGMIVKRGFPPPPDYAIARLRKAPVGHFYDVITNGYGAMYSYASRVPPKDRWAIAAYIRALQAARPVVAVETDREKRLRAREMGIGTRPVDESMEPAEGGTPPHGERGPAETSPALPQGLAPGPGAPSSGGEAPARGNP